MFQPHDISASNRFSVCYHQNMFFFSLSLSLPSLSFSLFGCLLGFQNAGSHVYKTAGSHYEFPSILQPMPPVTHKVSAQKSDGPGGEGARGVTLTPC